MNGEKSALGQEIETALSQVLDHVRGDTRLACRIIDDPSAERTVALRKRLRLSRQKFAERFGLDARAVQEWEQCRRAPDRAARVTRLKRLRPYGKTVVFGIVGRRGQVYTEIDLDCSMPTLQAIIRGRLEQRTVINSDGWGGHDALVNLGYGHFHVVHSRYRFTKSAVHINGIEGFWSLVKVRLAKFERLPRHTFHLHLRKTK